MIHFLVEGLLVLLRVVIYIYQECWCILNSSFSFVQEYGCIGAIVRAPQVYGTT